MAKTSRERRLEQRIKQEKEILAVYARKLEYMKEDLALEQDEGRRDIRQKRIAREEKERAEVKAKLERCEQELMSLQSGDEQEKMPPTA